MQVRSVPVVSRRMELAELSVRPAKTETVRSVEASLRLDAVASAGFRISRAKAADLIKQGDVRCAAAVIHAWAVCTSVITVEISGAQRPRGQLTLMGLLLIALQFIHHPFRGVIYTPSRRVITKSNRVEVDWPKRLLQMHVVMPLMGVKRMEGVFLQGELDTGQGEQLGQGRGCHILLWQGANRNHIDITDKERSACRRDDAVCLMPRCLCDCRKCNL